ncbi:hypothetical protein CHS0354_023140 [Potamilus streckersoni]|uniref:Uncharacterized protein n=1 Tax=Potamilus streckersoni TaxID=2493646 RepID=A0AAE0RNB5_9BIVA|nr:hypothetical protein CHS0354_023140 [Potamilus streckersoni]
MADIKALRLIRQDIDNLKGVSNPPKDSQDEKRLDDFEKKCTFVMNHSVDTITQVAKYAKEMDRQLEELRLILNNSTEIKCICLRIQSYNV